MTNWVDIGLEASESDVATKISSSQVNFKLSFANQGDGFRVYYDAPTTVTPCTCPSGQVKAPDPKSPVCILRANVITNVSTDFVLTGYGHLVGNCTLTSSVLVPKAPLPASNQITVTAGLQRAAWA
jgi:hypothetical protein